MSQVGELGLDLHHEEGSKVHLDMICRHNGLMDSVHTPPENSVPIDEDEISGQDIAGSDLDIDELTDELEQQDPAEAPDLADEIADTLAARLDRGTDH